ncbi:MAG TPA: phenylalanine--tRNA ligase subunit beta, partial [Verrucomicrobiae bacterium]|nr:phenylalanine--tRNA ligase subunit beta [Verrucomicrobiae bacterium]
MKISFNKIRYAGEHSDVPDLASDGLDKLVERIGAQLGAVEEVIPYGNRFDGVIVVKVVECEKHPDADKLSLCRVDDGGVVKGVERDGDSLVQVVCGAPNVRAGILAAWLPPGAVVPSTRDKEPFVLEVRDFRGKTSNGMLASLKELGIGDDHEGILEVDADANPGTTFTEAYRAEGEVVIDIENKMFTHRPDCFGLMGVTREVAGIQQKSFKSPAWYVVEPKFPEPEGEALPLKVTNELPKLVPRFTTIAMSDVKVGPSPGWLQIVLSELGIRPINNIVDFTNFWMLETGQPLHAYDYDKLKALSGGEPHIVIRKPHKGEKIKLLNGKEIVPHADAIMIATDKQLIGVGGIMGGSETEVDVHTRNIVLECANFDMYSVRRTSMTHGLFTDAVTRF